MLGYAAVCELQHEFAAAAAAASNAASAIQILLYKYVWNSLIVVHHAVNSAAIFKQVQEVELVSAHRVEIAGLHSTEQILTCCHPLPSTWLGSSFCR